MRQLLASVVAIVLLSACTQLGPTVTQMGPGRYMAVMQGVTVFATPARLLADAMQEANKFCAEQELYAVAENFAAIASPIPNSQVIFRCMSEAEARQFQKAGGRWNTVITPPPPRTNINLYR